MEKTVLLFHLIGVLIFVAGIAVAAVAFEAARKRESAAEIALLLGLTRAGVTLVGLGAMLLFVCGLWLVELAEIGFGAGWISAAIALFVLAMILGGIGGQAPKGARRLATQLAGEGELASPELRALLEDPVSRVANYASSALIVAVLVLMVFKP